MSYAHITIAGNIGSCEVLSSGGGNKYVRISVAVNYGKKEQRKTTWYSVMLFGKLVEDLKNLEYYKVGRSVLATGRPQSSAYARKDGSLAVDNSIIASEWPILMDRAE